MILYSDFNETRASRERRRPGRVQHGPLYRYTMRPPLVSGNGRDSGVVGGGVPYSYS